MGCVSGEKDGRICKASDDDGTGRWCAAEEQVPMEGALQFTVKFNVIKLAGTAGKSLLL